MDRKEIEKKIELLESHIKSKIPNYNVIDKEQSTYMKILNVLISLFNKNFMNRFTTTLYPNIYYPKYNEIKKSSNVYDKITYFSTLCHEYVHLKDRKQLGIMFNIFYLFPQILALLTLLSFYNLYFLLCLGFLLPIPSIGRAYIEKRGYVMTIACRWWIYGEKSNIENIVNQFVSANYYFMFPFKDHLIRYFEKEQEKIIKNELSFEALKEVNDILSK